MTIRGFARGPTSSWDPRRPGRRSGMISPSIQKRLAPEGSSARGLTRMGFEGRNAKRRVAALAIPLAAMDHGLAPRLRLRCSIAMPKAFVTRDAVGRLSIGRPTTRRPNGSRLPGSSATFSAFRPQSPQDPGRSRESDAWRDDGRVPNRTARAVPSAGGAADHRSRQLGARGNRVVDGAVSANIGVQQLDAVIGLVRVHRDDVVDPGHLRGSVLAHAMQ